MWDNESGLVNRQVAIQDQVEVERAGRARIGPLAAEVPFDVEQRTEQIARGEGRCSDDGGVQKARLGTDADGLSVVERRHAQVGDVLAEGGDGVAEDPFAVALIAAERDGDRDRHGAQTINHQRPEAKS